MCVVKTWANAWATSHRMHETIVLPCLFRCAQTDSLQHYIFCPILFALLRALHPDVSEMPLERIGLQSSSAINLQRVSALFAAYHACKRAIKDPGGRLALDAQALPLNLCKSMHACFLKHYIVECQSPGLNYVAYTHMDTSFLIKCCASASTPDSAQMGAAHMLVGAAHSLPLPASSGDLTNDNR